MSRSNFPWYEAAFFGGLCGVCRKRPRCYTHARYPSMCDGCRESRTFKVKTPYPSGDALLQTETDGRSNMEVLESVKMQVMNPRVSINDAKAIADGAKRDGILSKKQWAEWGREAVKIRKKVNTDHDEAARAAACKHADEYQEPMQTK